MVNWFHRLFNPHCPDCLQEKRESLICNSCETLLLVNEKLNYQNEQLMRRIMKEDKPEENQSVENIESKPAFIPWRVKQQLLEKEDRVKARLMREAAKPIEQVEKEVLG